MTTSQASPTMTPDERERLLIEAVVALAKSLRDERDRLARRLREVEEQLSALQRRTEGAPPTSPRAQPDSDAAA